MDINTTEYSWVLGTVVDLHTNHRNELIVTIEVVDEDMQSVEYVLSSSLESDLSYLAVAGACLGVCVWGGGGD